MLIFFAFRIMVGLGLLMIAFGVVGAFLAARKRLFGQNWYLHWAVLMGPAGFIAVLSGWVVAEVGRQPYTVYGLLRTAESASPIDAPAVAVSLAVFAVVYFLVFGAGVWFILRLMGQPFETGPALVGQVTRAAGITPAPALRPDSVLPTAKEN
jgi:cytochrome d ubiquinol oxidase subunit I